MNKPTYKDSNGNRYSTEQINRKSDLAAKGLLKHQLEVVGFNHCERCYKNASAILDVSHTISRKKAKEDGCVEKIWDDNNMEILCRSCHQEKDKLNLQFG